MIKIKIISYNASMPVIHHIIVKRLTSEFPCALKKYRKNLDGLEKTVEIS